MNCGAKQMKRIIAFILMAIISCSMIFCISCSKSASGGETSADNNGTFANTDEPTAEADPYDPGLPETDFAGMKFRILTIDPDDRFWWSNTQVDATEETGDIVNDAIYKRNRSIEKKYNFIIDMAYMTDAQLTPAIKNSVSSGSNDYEMVIPPIDRAAAMSHSGYLYNLNNVDYLDFSRKWWNPSTLHNYSIGNKLYFATGDFILSDDDAATSMMYNKNLAQMLGTPSADELFDVVMAGGWTVDLMFDIAAEAIADLNGDGRVNYGDRFGLAACHWVQTAFMGACNETLTKKDENDLPVFNAGNERFINVFDKINSYITNKQLVAIEYMDFPQDLGDLTMNDYALFTAAELACVRLFRSMESDFAILPFPKFDTTQDKYYSFMVTSTCMAIPTSNADTATTGLILEALNAESGRLVNPAYYEIAVAKKYFRDDKSFRILELILENPVCDVLYWVHLWGGFDATFTNLVRRQGSDIVSTVEKNRDKVEAAIQKTVEIYAELP